jgi:hypothetical protein
MSIVDMIFPHLFHEGFLNKSPLPVKQAVDQASGSVFKNAAFKYWGRKR